ncbi:MAG: ATP-binding cassette domain-containing protein [Okeania sp. SIO3B5]|uniref:ATP-binding cassette domain-containing protein n=1 Tax=Okeania sp. SIO3B5 TaxID=2607811 RepID=UPI00140108B9|nr:ATP-binding cassette domain-containing protein [Okeania sp. SIO3B5]NEO54889.1 ATP-binding cassette domain-containing protein [Okeania sp. SIO3B5]
MRVKTKPFLQREATELGKSGSGKSTIANLVCGLYEPKLGEILFDYIARREIPRSVLTKSVSMVALELEEVAGGKACRIKYRRNGEIKKIVGTCTPEQIEAAK